MIDFAPNEEQTAIRDLAHQIAVEQFRKHARAAEEAGDMPAEVRRVLAETGLLTPFPEEYGGSGTQEAVTHALIMEELAWGDGGLALHVFGSILAPLGLLLAGQESDKLAFLALCAEEESAVGWSEPATGLDVRQMESVLHTYDDGWRLDINKRGVIHGHTRGIKLALVRLETSSGNEGPRLLFLPPDDPEGVIEVTTEEAPLGLRAAPRARWRLRDGAGGGAIVLGLPISREIPDEGKSGTLRFVALANVLLGGLAVGIARAALDYAADYAQNRIQFGKPISSFQAIAFMAAEMAMEVDAARLLIWRAANSWDTGKDTLRLAERARRQAIKTAQRVTTDAVQILGGAGFLQDHPVELWMRDAAALAALG
jgi:alkylation response protein AidB-like acyl-CoA dehydrogenase